jgi:hypothetical protein
MPVWDIITNYEYSQPSCIWVCRNKDHLEIKVLSKSEQEVSCRIKAMKKDLQWVQ